MSESRTGLTPDAEERLRAARDIVQTKLTAWGPMRVMHGAALGLVLLGAILPVATVAQFGFFTSSTSGVHFYNFGFAGWLTVLVGTGLAAAPFVLRLPQRSAMIGFGLLCVGLGMLLVPYVLSTYTSNFAQLAVGYYALVAAYLLLVAAYWRRMNHASGSPSRLPETPTTATTEGIA
jgi:hypothetical protein